MDKTRVIQCIQICLFLLLVGRGILHFTSPPPYELLFSGSSDLISIIFGVALIFFGTIALAPSHFWMHSSFSYAYIIPSLIIFTLSLATYYKAGSVIEQIIEHALQWSLPILFIILVKSKKLNIHHFMLALMLFSGLTFIGHGLFAIGFHYVPGNFIVMTTASLRLSVDDAMIFLLIMGLLDVLAAVVFFYSHTRKIALIYMIFWGIITAFARSYYALGNIDAVDFWGVNFINTLYRLPHGLIPLFAFVFYFARQKEQRKIVFSKYIRH